MNININPILAKAWVVRKADLKKGRIYKLGILKKKILTRKTISKILFIRSFII